jgi:hypothetical protein
MEKLEKGPKEVFTPDIQKVTDQKIFLVCPNSSSSLTNFNTQLVIIQNAGLDVLVLVPKAFPSHVDEPLVSAERVVQIMCLIWKIKKIY